MSLTGPDARIPDDLLSSAYTMQATVESWLGDEYLGEVPVEDGSVAWDATQQVQGSLSLTVPARRVRMRTGGTGILQTLHTRSRRSGRRCTSR